MLYIFLRRLTLVISVYEILVIALDHPVIASDKFNQDNNIPVTASFQNDDLTEKSRLDQSLEIINKMDDSQHKVILLNDLALSYSQLGNQEKASSILGQSLSITNSFEDLALKVTTMNNIAKYYAQIDQKTKAIEILDNTFELVSNIPDQSQLGQLLLEISLKYGEIGEEESAQRLFTQSQEIIAKESQPLPDFPFTETPPTFKLGFSGNVNSFRDTTGFLGVNVDFVKQWPENDIFYDGNIYVDYDSSRSVNNYRPGSLIISSYRHHFSSQWNFFTNFFNSTNQDLFSSKNDDEDLVIDASIFFGGGLNLWRGDSPSSFLDLQLGVGPRYEYDYIDFEQRRNQVSPNLAIILLGRSLPIGSAKLNHRFVIAPALNDFNDYVVISDSKFSIPLSKKWSFTNRLFARYRNELIFQGNPKVEFFFSTGLEYEF